MKLINLILISIILFSCTQNQENNDLNKTNLEGKWKLINIKNNEGDTVENMEMALFILMLGKSDFKYIKFTDNNTLQLLNSNEKILNTKNYKLLRNRLVLNSQEQTDSMKLIWTDINSIKLVFKNDYEYYFDKEQETNLK